MPLITIVIEDEFDEGTGDPEVFLTKRSLSFDEAEGALAKLQRAYEQRMENRNFIMSDEE